MMTFSRIYLNPHLRQGRKLLTNPEAMHAAVSAAFPPNLDESSGRVLWRVDHHSYNPSLKQAPEHVLYIVAPAKPRLTHIAEQAGWESSEDNVTETIADYTRFLDSLMADQIWRFELVANPTRSLSQGTGKRGKRVPCVTIGHQTEWLMKQAPKAGFTFNLDTDDAIAPTVVAKDHLAFPHDDGDRRKWQKLRLTAVRYTGVLKVTDAEKLRYTLTHGLGRGRAYGCGLMTLAKPREGDGFRE
ncbi:MAG: type I-E CRISPR-associated protein Cas6/Cse3/CasE [Corynebacterium sp.]|nr:type I-E CRISPR-associated protein Cas6/Cse3/CasE [Corynebacterium sp.]